MMAESSSNGLEQGVIDDGITDEDLGNNNLCIDLDKFFDLLEEPDEHCNPSQNFPEDLSVKNASEGEVVPGDDYQNYQLHNGNHLVCSDSGKMVSAGSFNSTMNHDMILDYRVQEPSEVTGSHFNAFSPDVSQYCDSKNIDLNSCDYGTFEENRIVTFGRLENNSYTSMEMSFLDAEMSSRNITSAESSICQSTEIHSDNSAMPYGMGVDDAFLDDNAQQHFHGPYNSSLPEDIRFPTESACSATMMKFNGQRGRDGNSVFGVSVSDYSNVEELKHGYRANSCTPLIGCSSLMPPLSCAQSYMLGGQEAIWAKNENLGELAAPNSFLWNSVDIIDDAVSREHSYSAEDHFYDEDFKPSFSGISCSLPSPKTEHHSMGEKEDLIVASKRARHSEDLIVASQRACHSEDLIVVSKRAHHCDDLIIASKRALHSEDNIIGSFTSPNDYGHVNLNAPRQYMPPFPSSKINPMSMGSHLSKVSPESIHSNYSEKSLIEDEPDVCIIEDMSHPAPAPPNRSLAITKSLVTPQHTKINDNHMGVGGMKLKARDERRFLRLLQDLSQPKSESSPPDGVLTVPLLRHQRIALSWMVQKEKDSPYCSGGILADDQGLGKTVSTIALILEERPPPSFTAACQDVKKYETLNLDDDDDEMPPELEGLKQESDTLQIKSNRTPMNSADPLVQSKGRPAAGTLVVCPTSVLRQWADELLNKVTSKAKLSVLVYHGSNRTKDPSELAKYDVVLTTYSIVSMEVPKLPRVDEDEEDKGKPEDDALSTGKPKEDALSTGLLSRKRKNPPSSDKKKLDKKALESAYESAARPLAKVRWFRVVLDEAQSIKNHRTQVARACWGLRAKRRWCLSGTPIQNAIDDLYSYFRFLKYEPYDVYNLFCSNIKASINRNPTTGYRKLQTVLKAIMLRRTKATLLDGEPIITLPPKFVELKKVEFSKEERDFYSRLEADSRAQFKEYAAAGTVKQNYVNILLMLLRLRQACDHPRLVRRYNSNSLWQSSEVTKKLPRDQQIQLLNCLEGSLAICVICNDSPEDAVVSKCGHVFCYQCINEHLTSDDNQCPHTNCKAQINTSSVFSKAALNSSLCDQPLQDCSPGSGSEVLEAGEFFYESSSYNSSKIKAAVAVLQSLCRQQDCSSGDGSMQKSLDGNASSTENSSVTHANEPPKDVLDAPDRQNLDLNKSSNASTKVGQKAIVFSQWTRMLDLLEDCLKSSSIQYRRLDGTMSVTARDKAVKDFNTLPEVTVMIMSLKAASLGLNMVAACHVLLLDLWWNPTTEDQAIDRAHRIGQTRPVTVLRLTVKDTVEDRILALQEKKREMVASAFGEDETGGRQTRLTVEDLQYLFMSN
ncbi:hypothetical protein UlMin_011799 [Ulmus minor]